MTVNDHNKPDYDIIIEIITLVKELRQNYKSISYHYIKSEKPNEKSDKPRSHETEMHMFAHHLSQEAKKTKDVPYINMPHNNVNIIINDQHVNSMNRLTDLNAMRYYQV